MAKVVIVEWLDAHTTNNEEIEEDDVAEKLHVPFKFSACGYLIRSDKAGVSLCTEIGDCDGVEVYRGAHFIPRGMIRRVKVVSNKAPTTRAGARSG